MFGGSLAVSALLNLLHAHTTAMVAVTVVLWAGRLRDIGRSAWWVLAIVALLAVSTIAAWSLGEDIAVGVGTLVELVIVGVLGAIPGQPGPNRFGPPPGQPSVAQTANVFS
jgi:uncharacterized membrane protein YhaH (DUF805 family)